MHTVYKFVGLAISCLLLSGHIAMAQDTEDEDDSYPVTTTFGLTTNTNSGIVGGLVFRQSRLLSGTLFGLPQHQYISVELVNVKHPKELSSSLSNIGSRYIEGKENYLFVVRPQYGREVKLFQRNGDEGIAVSGILAVGPSLAIIKPYYLEVSFGNNTRTVPASQVNGFQTPTGETVTVPVVFFRALANRSYRWG